MTKLLTSILILLLLGCALKKQSSVVSDLHTGKLSDQRGLDGCGWVIVIDKVIEDGVTRYEPVNLQDFKIEPEEGMPVKFNFDYFEGNSVCMVGKLITLKTLKRIDP